MIGSIWGRIKPCPEITFLCMNEDGVFPPLSVRSLHAVLWKMILIEFTLTGLEPGRSFGSKTIFPYVFTRMHTRLCAKIHVHRRRVSAALRHGKPPPSDDSINAVLSPFASMHGSLVSWHEAWKRKGLEFSVSLDSFR